MAWTDDVAGLSRDKEGAAVVRIRALYLGREIKSGLDKGEARAGPKMAHGSCWRVDARGRTLDKVVSARPKTY